MAMSSIEFDITEVRVRFFIDSRYELIIKVAIGCLRTLSNQLKQ